MSVRTKKPPTDAVCTLTFVGPVARAGAARDALHTLGFEEARDEETRDTVPWRDCFPAWSESDLPGVALAGARTKAGLTQLHVAHATGIPQRHISEMEHGKRSIGKDRAKKLAAVLQVDYHILL